MESFAGYVPIEAVMEKYGACRSTACNWCRAGYFVGARLVGRAWWIPEQSLDNPTMPLPAPRRGRRPKLVAA